MILHCYYCAIGGDRPTEASQVAIVDEKALCKPLRADMFKPLKPQHDNTPPFQSDEWRFMLHRACGHYPWPFHSVDKDKGPSKMFTDQGMVEIPSYICDVCGKPCKSLLGLNSHKRSHNA